MRGDFMSTVITVALVAVIVFLSLRKYVKMSKEGNGCGCGCDSCPSKSSCHLSEKEK
jgi:large-conductance mechanosensitive channel